MMIPYILAALLVFVSGCTTVHPTVTQYRLHVNKEFVPLKQSKCAQKTLKIFPLIATDYTSSDMHYVVGDLKEYSYNASKWRDTPNRLVSDFLVDALSQKKIFLGVFSYKSVQKTDYLLEFHLNEFMQHYNNDENKSYAKLDMSVHLYDRKTHTLAATRRFQKELPLKELGAEAGVKALSEALYDVSEEMAVWLVQECR